MEKLPAIMPLSILSFCIKVSIYTLINIYIYTFFIQLKNIRDFLWKIGSTQSERIKSLTETDSNPKYLKSIRPAINKITENPTRSAVVTGSGKIGLLDLMQDSKFQVSETLRIDIIAHSTYNKLQNTLMLLWNAMLL